MKILIAYSSKTKNTKKIAEHLYKEIKNFGEVTLLDIKKARKNILQPFDFYFLGCWVDKATLNKNMRDFIAFQNITNKKTALFMTCGVPSNHYHAHDSIANFKNFVLERNNTVFNTFICQGKIDPKILIVFKFLTWKDPNFIHKIDNTMLEWVESSKSHPNKEDFSNIATWGSNILIENFK